jgi:hypothetical protein
MSGTACSFVGTLIVWRRAFAAAHKLATFLTMVFARSGAPGELHAHQN